MADGRQYLQSGRIRVAVLSGRADVREALAQDEGVAVVGRPSSAHDADLLITEEWPPSLLNTPILFTVVISEAPVSAPGVIWMPAAAELNRLPVALTRAKATLLSSSEVLRPVPTAASNFLSREAFALFASKFTTASVAWVWHPSTDHGADIPASQWPTFDPLKTRHAWCRQAVEMARESRSNIRISGWAEEPVFFAGGTWVHSVAVLDAEQEPEAQALLSLSVDGGDLMVNADDPMLVSAETLLWRLAVQASGGRLPVSVSWEAKLLLKHWPNTTQLDLPSGALRLFALWHGREFSFAELCDLSGLEARLVATLVSAACLSGLVENVDGPDVHRVEAAAEQRFGFRFWRRKR